MLGVDDVLCGDGRCLMLGGEDVLWWVIGVEC